MVPYAKMYATLVGRVDDVLQYMEGHFQDAYRMELAAGFLRKALLEAEDTYLAATEDEEERADEE